MPRLPASASLEQSLGRIEGTQERMLELLEKHEEHFNAIESRISDNTTRILSLEQSRTLTKWIGGTAVSVAAAIIGWFAPGFVAIYMRHT